MTMSPMGASLPMASAVVVPPISAASPAALVASRPMIWTS